MPCAYRHFLSGHGYHIAHGCHQKALSRKGDRLLIRLILSKTKSANRKIIFVSPHRCTGVSVELSDNDVEKDRPIA
jgi:hypothetical protein